MKQIDSLNILINQAFIDQIPGLFVVMDLESRFLAMNKTALEWTGFKSYDAMVNETYCNMPCKVAEKHEVFVQQDNVTRERNGPLKILGYYCYANDEWRVLFGDKYPLKNRNNEIIATVSQFSDITNHNLIDLSKLLKISTEGNSIKIPRKQIEYMLEDNLSNSLLSSRQSECLFFLLRGKTAKQIAKILNLSFRTVEEYIEQMKIKLNCSTKSELINKAIAEGYMNIIPGTLLEMLK